MDQPIFQRFNFGKYAFSGFPNLNQCVSILSHYDVPAGISLGHLSFILRQFLPQWHPDVNGTRSRRHRELLQSEFERLYRDQPQVDPELSGSLFEGLNVPFYYKASDPSLLAVPGGFEKIESRMRDTIKRSDMDIMSVMKHRPFGNEDQEPELGGTRFSYLMETDDCHPGYMRLRHRNDEETGPYLVQLNGRSYFYSSKLKAHLENYIPKITATIDIPMFVTGPSLCSAGSELKMPSIVDQDFVPALWSPVWPKQAREWLTRTRPSGWPSAQLIDEIRSLGCLAVATAHPRSSNRDAEWRLSFSIAEKRLATTLLPCHRQCYMLLKLMSQIELQCPKVLSSYCLKNILFWTMEKIPESQWLDRVNGTGKCFLALLDRLLGCLVARNLPHYFNPGNNLVSHVNARTLQDVAKKVSEVRRDPIKFVLDFDRIYRFQFSSQDMRLEDLLEGVIRESRCYGLSLTQEAISQKIALCLLANARLDAACFDALIHTVNDMKSVSPFGVTERPVEYILDLAHRKNPRSSVACMEHLLEKFPDQEALILTCLAPKYHAFSRLSHLSQVERNAYACKSEELFSRIPPGNPSTETSYCSLLMDMGKTRQAIPLLKKATEQSGMKPDYLSYDEHDARTLDDDIRSRAMTASKVFRVRRDVFSCFQLVKCYISIGDFHNATKTVERMAEICERAPDMANLNLLGFSYERIGENAKAKDALELAQALPPSRERSLEDYVQDVTTQLESLKDTQFGDFGQNLLGALGTVLNGFKL